MFGPILQHLNVESPAIAAVAMLVLVIMAGTAAQVLAERLRLPATGPLLIMGLLLGPAGLALVQPEMLGEGLRVIVRAAVAIVVFEGALLLDVGELRRTSRAALGLVTVGLLITTSLAAAASYWLIGWSRELSLLFGAIVSVTGPTVIGPILQKVRVNRRVRITLESESIIADPLGVILAAIIFTAITHPLGWKHAGPHALQTVGSGIGVGVVVAGLVWLTAGRMRLLPAKYARLGILGAALASYTLAEALAHEAGVLAAAVAGIVVGSVDIPHKERVEEFKGDIASLAVSAVFILLAASLDLGDLAALGWKGALVVFLLMFVIRPVRVFLSTIGSELKTNEKWFVSFLGPRGIVAASVATFFSLQLVDTGHPNGRIIVPLVFAVILGTVLVEGSAAGWLARVLNVMPQQTIIVGADEIARRLAEGLAREGESVTLLDTDEAACMRAGEMPSVRVLCQDATDAANLRKAGIADAKCLIAATRSDKVNLLVCELVKASFSVPRLVARVNNEAMRPAFQAAGIEAVSPAIATADALHNVVLRPSLYHLLARGNGGEHVAEVELTSEDAVGKTLKELAFVGCAVVAVRRGDEVLTPSGSTRLQKGDVLTLLGGEQDVISAASRLERKRKGQSRTSET